MRNKDLARAIKKLRTDLGLTMAEVARRVGVSKTYISEVERGREPSVHVLAKIADVLGTNWRDLAAYSDKYIQPTMSAEEFRKIRKQAGLTQEELAQKMFRHVRSIEHYESGWPIPRWVVNGMRGIAAGKK